jgi:hypothetical protein
MKLRQILGIIFASPVTLVTFLFYALPFTLLGWYRYDGWHGMNKLPTDKSPLGVAPVFVVQEDKSPKWLLSLWERWAGHCVGTLVVVRHLPGSSNRADVTLTHELHHVQQFHTYGFFQPLMYAISSLFAYFSGEDAYTNNIFEVSARRVAGQVVDVQSYVQGYAAGKNQAESLTKSANDNG